VKAKSILGIAFLAAASLLPAASRAGSLSTSIIGIFPKNVGEFAYADLKTARRYKWFQQLKDQMLPPRYREFEKFLASAGVDPNSQVDELAWAFVNGPAPKDAPAGAAATTPTDQIIGIALGQFNPSSAEIFFTAQKLATQKVRGFTLFAFGSGSGPQDLFFFFIDSNTAAFGQRANLEKMIDVRAGLEEGLLRSDTMFPMINEMNGRGLLWAVLDSSYSRLAINQLLPEASQYSQASQLTAKLKAMLINVDGGSTLDARFQTVCATSEDANTFAALLQPAIMFRQYQENQTNPELAQLLGATRVAPRGDRLDVRMSLTEEQMVALIRRNTFAFRM
jgi:hypothetical protein